LKTNLNK